MLDSHIPHKISPYLSFTIDGLQDVKPARTVCVDVMGMKLKKKNDDDIVRFCRVLTIVGQS